MLPVPESTWRLQIEVPVPLVHASLPCKELVECGKKEKWRLKLGMYHVAESCMARVDAGEYCKVAWLAEFDYVQLNALRQNELQLNYSS